MIKSLSNQQALTETEEVEDTGVYEEVNTFVKDEAESVISTQEKAKEWTKKLTSRKFLMALVPAVAAIAALFGYSENQVVTIASAVVIVISSVGYMWTEGKCDQESIKASSDALMKIIESLKDANAKLQGEVDAANARCEALTTYLNGGESTEGTGDE